LLDSLLQESFSQAPGMASVYQKVKKNVSSLYTDPFKWGVVKSLGIFVFGIYIARDLKGFAVDSAVAPAN